jgi:fermentation-respiration switch protein FrsA (DUF1100 family)
MEQPRRRAVTAQLLVAAAVRRAAAIRCPILLVVAEHDTMAPVAPALRVVDKAPHGELYRSRGGHYDVYEGGADHDNVLNVEVEFLHRHAKRPPV